MTEPAHPVFVTIDYFMIEMMGYRNKASYYDHLTTPGWPQRVYPGDGRARLVYEECVAYQRKVMADRTPPVVGPPVAKGRKRHIRPRTAA